MPFAVVRYNKAGPSRAFVEWDGDKPVVYQTRSEAEEAMENKRASSKDKHLGIYYRLRIEELSDKEAQSRWISFPPTKERGARDLQ